jgi:deoxyribonuclease V
MKLPDNVQEAKELQNALKQKIRITGLKSTPELIAGVDAAFFNNKAIGVACLFTYPALIPLEDAYAVVEISFPYIPGFLSFREGPAIIKAIDKLTRKPDLILFDGQGIAHPQGMGIAAHIGVLLNIPSVGCAKSKLVGHYTEPGKFKGQHSQLKYRNQIVGVALRTRYNVNPVFVSPGHLIDLEGAINIVLNCTGKYRIPEPLRRADILSKKLKKSISF